MPLDSSWLSAGGNKTMFGHADWLALRARGITSAQQLAKLRDNQQYLMGPQYKDGVLTHRGNKEGVAYLEGFGLGSNQSSGVEHTGGLFNQIRLHAQSQAKPWSSISGVNDWEYGIWGGKGFGAKDIEEASNRGASAYQLKQLHERAGQLGVNTDNPDAEAVLANAPVSPWDFGAHGGWGFGKKDLEAMEAQGKGYGSVLRTKQWAQDQKLNIGAEVDSWILRKKGEINKGNDVDWQTNTLDPLNDLTAQINEPVEKPGVGYNPSVVGKSGTGGAHLQTSRRGNRRGTSRWKRSSWSMPTVNTGSTSGKSGNNPGLNV